MCLAKRERRVRQCVIPAAPNLRSKGEELCTGRSDYLRILALFDVFVLEGPGAGGAVHLCRAWMGRAIPSKWGAEGGIAEERSPDIKCQARG